METIRVGLSGANVSCSAIPVRCTSLIALRREFERSRNGHVVAHRKPSSTSPVGCTPTASLTCNSASCCCWERNEYAGTDGGDNNGGSRNGDNNGRRQGDSDSSQPQDGLHLHPALLGAAILATALLVGPEPSQATPATQSTSPPATASSVPTAALERPSSPTYPSSGFPSSAGGDPKRPFQLQNSGCIPDANTVTPSPRRRSKVMHVPCQGGTLVVPLPTSTGNGYELPRISRWHRGRIVDTPVQLSETETRLVAARQNRVRDSVWVC